MRPGGSLGANWGISMRLEPGSSSEVMRAVGETVSTPDQDIVDERKVAVGLGDGQCVSTDRQGTPRGARSSWDLDPESSEDYQERRE